MARLTLAAVNKAIAARGIAAELVRGDDYFYFIGDAVQWAHSSTTILVPRLNDYGLDRWMIELDRLAAESAERAKDLEGASDKFTIKIVRHSGAPDVAGLEALRERVARLNPEAGEIGAGMLASLVAEARRLGGEG